MTLADLVYIEKGLASARPASPPGKRWGWYATDTDTLSIWDGAAWNDVGGGGGGPTGSAGGVLDGTYPNPGLAAGVAGTGLAESSDVLSVNVDGTTIEIATDTLQVVPGVFDADGAAAAAQAASQPLDGDLTAIAGLSPTNDDIIQRKAGAWTNRTMTQLAADLGSVDVAAVTHAATSKSTPVDNDEIPLVDSAASNVLKKLLWSNLKATLKDYFDTLYAPIGGGSGYTEIAHDEFTSPVSVTHTTEATADTIVTASAFTADGSSAYLIEFFTSDARPDSAAAGRTMTFWLYEGGSSIGNIGFQRGVTTTGQNMPVSLFRRLIPASGSHTYSIRASVSAGTGLVDAGAGGSGVVVPGFVRITKVT